MIPIAMFLKDHHGIAKGSIMEFAPGVTLAVGDQGTGKSSLLKQLALWVAKVQGKRHDDRAGAVSDLAVGCIWEGGPAPIGYFDFERHNPRLAPAIGMYGLDAGTQVSSLFGSHGESVRGLSGSRALGKGTMLLDEPDMALSPRSIHALTMDLKAAAAAGGQIIAAVHNAALIGSFPWVLSMEHGRWMPSDEFLQRQASEPTPPMRERDAHRTITAYIPDGQPSAMRR